MKNKCVSVIIPAYNEEKCIAQNIQTVLDQMYRWRLQIVVVNDGSTDNTGQEILKFMNRSESDIFYVSYEDNMGKGFAVREGLKVSAYHRKLIIDADLSVNPSNLEYVKNTGENHWYIIKGERKQVVKQPIYRIFVGKAWQMLVYLFTGLNMDTQCPFTLCYLPYSFYSCLEIDGFAYDVELLYKAKKSGYNIGNMVVEYTNDPNSKVTLRKTIQMFKDLIRIRKSTLMPDSKSLKSLSRPRL